MCTTYSSQRGEDRGVGVKRDQKGGGGDELDQGGPGEELLGKGVCVYPGGVKEPSKRVSAKHTPGHQHGAWSHCPHSRWSDCRQRCHPWPLFVPTMARSASLQSAPPDPACIQNWRMTHARKGVMQFDEAFNKSLLACHAMVNSHSWQDCNSQAVNT